MSFNMSLDELRQLETLEGQLRDGRKAQEQRTKLIRDLIERGTRQADIWRAINAVRLKHGDTPITRDAVAMAVRRGKKSK